MTWEEIERSNELNLPLKLTAAAYVSAGNSFRLSSFELNDSLSGARCRRKDVLGDGCWIYMSFKSVQFYGSFLSICIMYENSLSDEKRTRIDCSHTSHNVLQYTN